MSINGKPVTGIDRAPLDICIKYLRENIVKPYMNKQGEEKSKETISLNSLRKKIANVPPGVSGNALDKYVQAYVLYVIGCFIALQKTGGEVSAEYLPLLANINQIKTFSWGASYWPTCTQACKCGREREANLLWATLQCCK